MVWGFHPVSVPHILMSLQEGVPVCHGSTLIKRRHLSLLGYKLVSVPHWEWDKLEPMDEQEAYLREKLNLRFNNYI